MLKKYTLVLGALVSLVSSVNAVPEWRQCGGVGFAGPTVCDAGLTCVYHNQFYSQCLRVSSSSSIRSSSSSISSSSTTKPVSSSVTTSAVSACPTPGTLC
ncbi:hypothetical protein FRC03_007756 [Tulasnella sp. 419]|nr:hypothetical protein FRC03_007756 [Tulasnella sp. 419]